MYWKFSLAVFFASAVVHRMCSPLFPVKCTSVAKKMYTHVFVAREGGVCSSFVRRVNKCDSSNSMMSLITYHHLFLFICFVLFLLGLTSLVAAVGSCQLPGICFETEKKIKFFGHIWGHAF